MTTNDDDGVGYGRPPKRTRFRKGQSGNPKGRPKGTINAASILRKEIMQKVTVREGGKPLTITKLEVVTKALMANAMKGDIRSIKCVNDMLDNLLGDEIRKGKTPQTWVDFVKLAMDAEAENE